MKTDAYLSADRKYRYLVLTLYAQFADSQCYPRASRKNPMSMTMRQDAQEAKRRCEEATGDET